jgi:L-fuconolactonase
VLIVDGQLHEFGPALDWDRDAGDDLVDRLMIETTLAWMDAVGVDAAILNPTDAGTPEGWGERAAIRLPTRFAVVRTLAAPEADGIQGEIEQLAALPSVFAVRAGAGRTPVDPGGEAGAALLKSGGFHALFDACDRYATPLFLQAVGNLPLLAPLIESHPDLTVIIDHLGLQQPPLDERQEPPWRELRHALELASYENVAMKLCGAPALSDTGYPFTDVWPHLHAILDAFTPQRVMWSSDIGRFQGRIGWDNVFASARGDYPRKHTYADSLGMLLHSDQLSETEKTWILGGAAIQLLGLPWSST